MKRLLFNLLLLSLFVSMRALAADYVALPHFSKTDKGLFGGQVGKGRMYFDITMPGLSANTLIDVGMAMSRIPRVIEMAPRWFSMFSPTACPYSELYAAPKNSIMITFRTYF